MGTWLLLESKNIIKLTVLLNISMNILKSYWIVQLTRGSCMVYKLYLNKAAVQEGKQWRPSSWCVYVSKGLVLPLATSALPYHAMDEEAEGHSAALYMTTWIADRNGHWTRNSAGMFSGTPAFPFSNQKTDLRSKFPSLRKLQPNHFSSKAKMGFML
jgi:hypothetical protein